MKYKHIYFEEIQNRGKKTKIWVCWNHSGEELGIVKWYSSWRQYCFDTNIVILSKSCLLDIADFLERVKDERNEALKEE